MSTLPQPALVVVVNNLRDWHHVLHDHWYRIPLRTAPALVAASFLAFYHTRRFGPDRWTIRWYAPVRRYQTLPRHAILPAEPDHPRANEVYYRIELGELTELPRPISSPNLRRVTFVPTTLNRLMQAATINELWHPDALDTLQSHFPHALLKAERWRPAAAMECEDDVKRPRSPLGQHGR